MKYIADLHCHPSFKPYNKKGYEKKPNGQPYTIWDYVPEFEDFNRKKVIKGIIQEVLGGTEKGSQTNLNLLVNNNVRSLFCVIHPIERGWFNIDEDKLLLKFAECLWDFKTNLNTIGAWFTGVPINKIKSIRKELADKSPLNYYLDETYAEYKFLRKSQKVKGAGGETFKLVSNYEEYLEVINDPDAVAGIITIEGGHALNNLQKVTDFEIEYQDHSSEKQNFIREEIYDNIERIKGIGGHDHSFKPKHTPFFLTLAHFYNNFLSGHAKSYTGIVAGIFDQKAAMYDGITPVGTEAIKKLLKRDRESGERRVLIDVKHMSLKARKQYYQIVKGLNESGDQVPIIFSHGAVAGYNWSAFQGEDGSDDNIGYFSHMSINLYHEDIVEIFNSDGLIGLAPHEGRMPGNDAKKEFKELARQIRWRNNNQQALLRQQRDAYVRLYLANIFQVIFSIGRKEAWDHVCIGSDYDGIMDPFDRYPQADDFNILLGDIMLFLKNPTSLRIYEGSYPKTLDANEIREMMYGYTPRQIADKIAFENIDLFLSKYFTDSYRLG